MNKIYESETMVVHDDREFIKPFEAYNVLRSGRSIQMCDLPNYSTENEFEMFPMPFTVWMHDIPEQYRNWPEMDEYFKGYELSR